jgi:hypothetical protein
MRTIMLLVLTLSLAAAAPAADLDDLVWREDGRDPCRWTRQPAWLGNPSASAAVAVDGQTLRFRVDEPGRGMKWSLAMPAVALDETPWMVVRYRAENLDTKHTDYFVYLDDRVPGRQLAALRPADAVADGRWHVAAVDLSRLTEAEAVEGLALQVQAGSQGKAVVWLDWLALMETPPEGAAIVRQGPVTDAKPDWVAPLGAIQWTAQPGWLGNPAATGSHAAVRQKDATLFRVHTAGSGMKWSCNLAEPVALTGRRYVSLRYRALRAGPQSDYALCVFGAPSAKGDPGYTVAVPSAEIVADGRWHTLHVDARRVAARYPTITGLAIQLQAAGADASLELADIRLTNATQPSRLADAVSWQAGASFGGFRPIGIQAAARSEATAWRRHLRLADWFQGAAVTVEGIPFARLEKGPELAATPLRGRSEISLATTGRASEIYLLMLAALVGTDEPAYRGGKLRALRDVDRFRLRLEYADGTADECLPMNVSTREFGVADGVQVMVAGADASKDLKAVVLCDLCKQGAFALAAATLRTGQQRVFPEALEECPPCLRLAKATAAGSGGQPGVRLEAPLYSSFGLPQLERLVHRSSGSNYLAGPCPLVVLRVDGRVVPPEDLKPVAAGDKVPPDQSWYKVRGADGLLLGLTMSMTGDTKLTVAATVRNDGRKEHAVTLVAPSVGPYRLGKKPDEAYYLVPRCGSILDHRPCTFREPYSGQFPVQFLDTFCPAESCGLTLRTEDAACLRKNYLLEKKDGQFTLGVEYPERTLRPGESLAAAPAVIAATDGDWHRGLDAYRRWVALWHKPLVPRKPWFREIFNFRQRFLWGLDPLYDAASGKLRLLSAVDEVRREFGGIDYLHLFDWGNVQGIGRIYGRTGDHDPYESLRGGRDALRNAIAEVQAAGVPVGLYIEGYLLEERGKLGRQFGRAWQLIGRDGRGMYWPDCSEMFVCAAVPAWREVQASTYAAKVRELNVDGMYIDEFGFANGGKDCWSKEHGHEVPSFSARTERECTRMIRASIEGVKRNVAVYTEESPVDLTTQYQDGSFTYAMSASQRAQTLAPLNLTRFALPDFKTIEILYCDKPTGSWATGVRWVFFNGEAIWLEGKADQWFEPETRAEIRRCYAILRKHRDAFTTLDPVPLVATEQGGVFCNLFPTARKSVYTLYNARHRTVRGPVLRLPHRDGVSYHDAWHDRPAEVRRDGPQDVINLEIGPHGAGCVVASAG